MLMILLCAILISSFAEGQTGLKADVSQFVVKKEGKSSSDCEAACKAESLLKCHYYLYLENESTCLLSSADHPDLAEKAQNLGLDPNTIEKYMKEKKELVRTEMDQVKNLKQQMNELDFKVKNFQKMKLDMENTLDKIQDKNSEGTDTSSTQTVLKINNKMQKLVQITDLLQAELSDLMNHHDSSSRDLRLLRQSKKKTDLELEQVVNNLDNLQTYIGSIKKKDDLNKFELGRLQDKQDQINSLMRQLKRQVQTTHSQLKNNPLIMRLLENEKTLTDSMQELDRKLTSFDNKQTKSDQTYDELYGRVINNEGERKALANSLSSLQKKVTSIKKDIETKENPKSSANMERLRTITTMKNDLSLLKRSSEELEKNLKLTNNELIELVKDLVNVRLGSQTNRAAVTAVALAHRHTQQTYDNMIKDQSGLLHKIHVLEDVYKTILGVIHNLEVHQVQLKQELSHFDLSVQRITHSIDRRLDQMRGASLSDKSSALGDALNKLTSDSTSGLETVNLKPNKKKHRTLKQRIQNVKKEIKTEEEKVNDTTQSTVIDKVLKKHLAKRKSLLNKEKKREPNVKKENSNSNNSKE